MKPFSAYSRRYERKRRLVSAALRMRDLTAKRDRTSAIRPRDVLLFATIRNEADRLKWFLDYYRQRGVGHFLIVDNGSEDGSAEMLEAQPDVSLWVTNASYKRANYGVHWVNALARRYAAGHWMLFVDPDEYLIYPHCDARDIPMLAEHLEAGGRRSLGTMLLDLYSEVPIREAHCAPGEGPGRTLPLQCQ